MQDQPDLIVLTYVDYVQLRRDLKEAGLDLCYMAQAGEPIRQDWSPDLLSDARFLKQVALRRPADASYRVASVWHARKSGWFRPDEFIVTFHATGVPHEAALAQYLSEHQIQSSTEAPKQKLARA